MNPRVVLERGGIVSADPPLWPDSPLRRYRLARPVTLGCVRCGREHRALVRPVVEDRELVFHGCNCGCLVMPEPEGRPAGNPQLSEAP